MEIVFAIPNPKQKTALAQFHHRVGSCTMNGILITHIAKQTITAIRPIISCPPVFPFPDNKLPSCDGYPCSHLANSTHTLTAVPRMANGTLRKWRHHRRWITRIRNAAPVILTPFTPISQPAVVSVYTITLLHLNAHPFRWQSTPVELHRTFSQPRGSSVVVQPSP